MPLPKHIITRLEKGAINSNINLLRAENARLSQSYKINTGAQKKLIDNAYKRLAYLVSRFPATYGVCEDVLSHLAETDLVFHSSLDLAAGPGTATLCASYLFPELTSRVMVDYDDCFSDFALRHLPNGKNIYSKIDLTHISESFAKRDLVLMSYALNELPLRSVDTVILNAWQATLKAFVIIEPGTPNAFDRLRSVRTLLIKQGAKILAPCPHNKPCPLEGNDWCHFSKRLERTALHKFVKEARLNHEDEKYSYLIAVKDHELLRPDNRIIKRPLKKSGHVTFDLCSKDGLQRLTISRKNKNLYKQALKYIWGDDFNIETYSKRTDE